MSFFTLAPSGAKVFLQGGQHSPHITTTGKSDHSPTKLQKSNICLDSEIISQQNWTGVVGKKGASSYGIGTQQGRTYTGVEYRSITPLTNQTLYPVWRPIELATIVAGNPDRSVDGVNTIGMFLTSAKANTVAGYLGVSTEDESRDPNYIPLACLGMRQRFKCGGVLNDKM
eukprot:Gb_04526 [translate_table: standard]